MSVSRELLDKQDLPCERSTQATLECDNRLIDLLIFPTNVPSDYAHDNFHRRTRKLRLPHVANVRDVCHDQPETQPPRVLVLCLSPYQHDLSNTFIEHLSAGCFGITVLVMLQEDVTLASPRTRSHSYAEYL